MDVDLLDAGPVIRFAGADLRAERARRGLRGIDIAWRLGVSRSRISHVEQLARVPAGFAARYLAVLDAYDAELEQLRSLRERKAEPPRPEPVLVP